MPDPLASLIDDESTRQRLFPITRAKIFLNHAAVTTLPAPVTQAMNEFNGSWSTDFPDYANMLALYADARKTAAELLHASPDEIALLGPTSLGLSLIALGLPWQPGDEVLCYFDDYPANVYPWLELRRRGVEVRFLQSAALGQITPDLVGANLSSRTRLVALASCNFVSGYRIDLNEIGRRLRERSILFCVDAIQTLGAFPTTVENVDFLSADAHKWLLGPLSSGVLYVRREHLETCRPALLGSWNTVSPNFAAQNEIAFVPGAQRYEPGALNASGIIGVRTAMRLLLDLGIERVAARISGLRAHLAEGLRALGVEPLGPDNPSDAAGILTVRHPGIDAASLHQALTAEGIICSLRQDRQGTAYVRFSPHFYNTEAELNHVLGILAKTR
ncbi:MAG TPA: aminotransferase class V-fold PLP-dependent enzyme [Chthoniobacterales bacterium]